MQVKVDNLKIIFIKKNTDPGTFFKLALFVNQKASFLDEIQNLPP